MPASRTAAPPQTGRSFNRWVRSPVMEDYSLRYAPRSFRTWSLGTVAVSGIGGIAAMASYAIGGGLGIAYGFTSSLIAVGVAVAVIFLTGLPIALAIARNNIDMDLLTRGAGFGYLGSTLTSLIYATFTFIFFAFEGAIMGQAITALTGIPIALSYLLAAVAIIPLVMYGMTLLSRFQRWTQPIWLVMLAVALGAPIVADPGSLARWTHFSGHAGTSGLTGTLFAGALAVLISGVAQIGEQADYLRFMPERSDHPRRRWLATAVFAGPGWVLVYSIQVLFGSYLASTIAPHVGLANANVPVTMFTQAFQIVVGNPTVALWLAGLLVILSQFKINVTNAYSGSLSWSNFFSRLTHRHPGRVVWLLLQVAIGLLIMELGVFDAISKILTYYSDVAVAWIGAVFADIVINKGILHISPPYIEFKRAHLYNFNPVGFGAMIAASVLGIATAFGLFGASVEPYAPVVSLLVALILAPVIAVATKGRYYIARPDERLDPDGLKSTQLLDCTVCDDGYEVPDMAHCPVHAGTICSLCCSLESTCHDSCKTAAYVGYPVELAVPRRPAADAPAAELGR